MLGLPYHPVCAVVVSTLRHKPASGEEHTAVCSHTVGVTNPQQQTWTILSVLVLVLAKYRVFSIISTGVAFGNSASLNYQLSIGVG